MPTAAGGSEVRGALCCQTLSLGRALPVWASSPASLGKSTYEHCLSKGHRDPVLPVPDATDHNECQDLACENGVCVNTDGSFHCFCSPPLVLDLSGQRCVNSTSSSSGEETGWRGGGWGWRVEGRGPQGAQNWPGTHILPGSVPPEDFPDHDIHMDICWKKVTNDVCSQPLRGHHTTYTECCCQDGEAWSQQCALCPPRSSGKRVPAGPGIALGRGYYQLGRIRRAI